MVCPARGHEIPRAFPRRHCLQLGHHSGVVHLAWEDAPRPQCSGSIVSNAGVEFARHLVQCTAIFAVNNVLLIALPASNLPDLCSCLRLGTSLAADLCLPMTGWVASACRNPVSGEEHRGATGDQLPPPPPHIPATRASLAAHCGYMEEALCHQRCRLAESPPLLCSVTYPRVVWLPVPLLGVRCARDCLVSVLSSPCPRYLHLSLTFPAGFCACWSAARNHVYDRCCVTTPRMSLYRQYMRLSERWAKLRAKLPPISVTLGGGWRWMANYALSAICKPC